MKEFILFHDLINLFHLLVIRFLFLMVASNDALIIIIIIITTTMTFILLIPILIIKVKQFFQAINLFFKF